MGSGRNDLVFAAALDCLIEPALTDLAARLRSLTGLTGAERSAIHSGTRSALMGEVHRKVCRLLVLELNAARVSGSLTAPSSAERWDEFVARAGEPAYWDGLARHYPSLRARLRQLVDNRCAAAADFADRFQCDRATLSRLIASTGEAELVEVSFGAGDSHRGGHSVAMVRCTTGRLVYKPRSVEVDVALAGLLDRLLGAEPAATRIRVPRVVAGNGYGWAEYIAHRYCAGEAELAAFYRNLGHWLAVTRLLGAVDLHAENVIACGPVPIVVDCETLFTPVPAQDPSGLGGATDRATARLADTVLRTGLLPDRGVSLDWRGVDASAIGALAGQQPRGSQVVVLDAGTDQARIGTDVVQAASGPRPNHPSPEPDLIEHWHRVMGGFFELTGELAQLDRKGRLEGMLTPFLDCPVRVVLRSTEAYAELARMLWHPVSLHGEEAAIGRATDLLVRMAENVPAPDSPDVVAAEIADLLVGDIPFFSTTPRTGQCTGPRGTRWLPGRNLIVSTLERWRAIDMELELEVIRGTLVSAYLNNGWRPGSTLLGRPAPRSGSRDSRRRALAAGIVRDIAQAAIRAEDATATWIAPVLRETGWSLQPLGSDLYSGVPGVALLLASYQNEVFEGRAAPIDGLDTLLAATLRTMRLAEEKYHADRRTGQPQRSQPPGGYLGPAALIWAWLMLDGCGAAGPTVVDRVCRLAETLPAALHNTSEYAALSGMAGAVTVLLNLADHTGQPRWRDLAVEIGRRLIDAADVRPGGSAGWPGSMWPEPLGGFAHGATSVGWALARLALATGEARFSSFAAAAFRYEESLYDPVQQGWRDVRHPEHAVTGWCYGAVGIGLAALDLRRRGWVEAGYDPDGIVRRAARSAWTQGLGWNHTLCHGDLGAWELLTGAIEAGLAPDGLEQADLDEHMIGTLEDHGPVVGFARGLFPPGLMSGVGGMAYQLLRLHPDSDLPSVLLPGSGRRARPGPRVRCRTGTGVDAS